MRRLARILLNALTVLLLVLFAATVALWVRGYQIYDTMGVLVRRVWDSRTIRVDSEEGRLAFVVTNFDPDFDKSLPEFFWYSVPRSQIPPNADRIPAKLVGTRRRARRTTSARLTPTCGRFPSSTIPFQSHRDTDLPVACAAATDPGLCPTCGYDLRATPERVPGDGISAEWCPCGRWLFSPQWPLTHRWCLRPKPRNPPQGGA